MVQRLIPGLAALLLFSAVPAVADLYGYVDENGRAHVSTAKLDDRYQLFKRVADRPASSASLRDARENLEVTAELTVPDMPAAAIKRYKKEVSKAAKRYDVEPALIHAVISAESKYDAEAVSYRGAVGLMQLMPDTATRYKVANAFDPAQNIRAGVRYLRDLLTMFDGDMELAIAAYNAGEGAVMKHGRKIPPFKETTNYVPKVLAYYKKYQQSRI